MNYLGPVLQRDMNYACVNKNQSLPIYLTKTNKLDNEE